jgi:hypothetical protein
MGWYLQGEGPAERLRDEDLEAFFERYRSAGRDLDGFAFALEFDSFHDWVPLLC